MTLERLRELEAAALLHLTERLAMAMVEEGFAVPSANRDEQWDAPRDEAYRIVLKLRLPALLRVAEAAEEWVAADTETDAKPDVDVERLYRAGVRLRAALRDLEAKEPVR